MWVNKILNVPKFIKRLWICLWIVLGLCVITKLCFNLWYPIVVENEFIIKACEFIDNNEILRVAITFSLYLLNFNFWFLTMIKCKKYDNHKMLLLYNSLAIISYVVKYFLPVVGSFVELFVIVGVPILLNLKRKTFYKNKINILFPIIIYLLINIWQLNIFFIRDINNILTFVPILILLTLQIDYYIFTIITWIGVNYYMGIAGIGFLWGKSKTELIAMKEKELAKEKPDVKLVKQIDEALEKMADEIKD